MLKNKVIASHVTNLTDARYFAARGVDFLLFDMDLISLDAAIQIKEWVEGPSILVLFSPDSSSLIDETILRLKPSFVGAKTPDVFADLAHLSAHVSLYKWSVDKIVIEEKLFLPLPSSYSSLQLTDGIIVRGGEEEAIGVKSYEDLDNFFDSIEIYH